MSENKFNKLFQERIPGKPTVLKQTKNFVELSFEQTDDFFNILQSHLLFQVQTKNKMLGWVTVYCGGRKSKVIDNLQPGRPHKFRLKLILRASSLKEIYELINKNRDKNNHDDINMILEKHYEQSYKNIDNKFVFNKLGKFDDVNIIIQNDDSHNKNLNNNFKEEVKCNILGTDIFVNNLNNDIIPTNDKDNVEETNSNESNMKDQYNLEIDNLNLNNEVNSNWIQTQWSEEFSTSTESEGPSVVCFCMAVRCGYLKQVQSMLEERPGLIDIRNTTDGFTPLATAVRKGNIQMVKYLLNAGADVNQISSTSQTSLHLSVLSGNISLTELLLERGADIRSTDANGLTLLHYAVDSGELDTVRYALGKCDVTARDNKGWTPLLRAVIQGSKATIVQELVNFGSDVEAKDNKGLTCVQYAALLKKREDLQRIVDKNFVRVKAVTNFTKLTKKMSTIKCLIRK